MKLAGDEGGHIFQPLAPIGTTTFLREAIRSLSGEEARGSISNAMNTYRWSRVSNLSFLTRCPRITCISLERERESAKKILSMNILQEDSQEHGSTLRRKRCTHLSGHSRRGEKLCHGPTYSAASVSFRAGASSTTAVTRSTLIGEKHKR